MDLLDDLMEDIRELYKENEKLKRELDEVKEIFNSHSIIIRDLKKKLENLS